MLFLVRCDISNSGFRCLKGENKVIGFITGLLFFGFGAFVLQGLRKIPADPPHYAVLTMFGKRTSMTKKEGWHFFPLYPWFMGYILVNMTKKNQDLAPNDVRTATDMAEIEIAVSLTWQPDADYLIEYLNSGEESGVKKIIADVVEEAVREFAADPGREPYTWEQAVKMRTDFLAEIVLKIMGKDPSSTTPDERKGVAMELGRGNGKLKIQTLGIVLNRVNVTSIKPKGELAKAAEKEATERREQKAEKVELEHIAERIEALKKLGFSNEQALEIIQTERGKVTKNITETKWNVSQETRDMIEKIGPEMVAKVASIFDKKG